MAQTEYLKNTFDRLSVLVTLRCDRSCKFCVYCCGPHRTEPPISIELVEKVLAEIKELNIKLVDGVHITGGESTFDRAI
jgi:molybdenum cofactor biosynthesis enzyme MoaA